MKRTRGAPPRVLFRRGPTAMAVAHTLSAAYEAPPPVAPAPLDSADEVAAGERVVLVVPILGDQRIPDDVDAWLHALRPRLFTYALCILGDLDERGAERRVAAEIARLLAQAGGHAFAPTAFVDVPMAPGASVRLTQWARASVPVPSAAASPSRSAPPIPASVPARRLVELLGEAPRLWCDASGELVGVALVTGDDYPRSLLIRAPAVAPLLWAQLATAPSLKRVSFAFARLKHWPLPPATTARLTHLDVRECRFADWRFLHDARALRVLNISTCGLTEIPREVETLDRLEALFCYKGTLRELPDGLWGLPHLTRVSVYRNALVGLSPYIARARGLRVLNVGANPIQALTDELTECALEALGLRLCGLRALPACVPRLPHLRQLDARKNPFLDGTALEALRHRGVEILWSDGKTDDSTAASGVSW